MAAALLSAPAVSFSQTLGTPQIRPTHRSTSISPTLIELSGAETVSDWIAVAQAVRSKDLDVVAVVLPTPDPTAPSVRVAEKLRDLLNRPDIPILPAIRTDVDGAVFAKWVDASAGPTESNFDLGDRILSLVAADSGSLQILSTGKLEGLTAAWRKDPKVATRLRRILLSGASIEEGVLGGFDGLEGQVGSVLFAATSPIVIFPEDLNRSLRLTLDDQLDLATARTPLTDGLTHLIALEAARSSSAWEEGVTFHHAAAVTYGFEKDVVELEKTTLALGSAVGTRIEVLVAKEYRKDAILAKLVADLKEPMIDFSYGFSHYLLNLSRLSGTTKLAISERLKNIPAPGAGEESGSIREDRIRQILDYLESTLKCFEGVTGDPAAEAARVTLLDTYRKVGSIGWQFSEAFYSDWTVDLDEDGAFELNLGISNPHRRLLRNIEVDVLQGETVLASGSRESATSEVVFDLRGTVSPPSLDGQQAEDVASPHLTVRFRMDCAGTRAEESLKIEVRRAR